MANVDFASFHAARSHIWPITRCRTQIDTEYEKNKYYTDHAARILFCIRIEIVIL